MARVAQTRRASRRRIIAMTVILLSTLAGIGGWMIAQASRPTSIARELRGPIVAEADTIEEQYLIALTRNDVPAWHAVLDFPVAPGALRSDYHDKAKLQLARLLTEQGEFETALRLLDELQRSTATKKLYLLIAKVQRHTIAMATEDPREASQLKTQIQLSLRELEKANPAAAEQFRRIVAKPDQLILGLEVN